MKTKTLRLKSKKAIDSLFVDGKSAFKYPIKLLYSPRFNNQTPSTYGVSVSKRSFKKAVDRNLIKRRMREAIQNINEHRLESHDVMLIYVGKEILDYKVIEKSVLSLLSK